MLPGVIPTRADRARDIIAALALLVSLGLDWNADSVALLRVDVAVITAVSLVSLTLPAASGWGLFEPAWSPARLRAAKLIAGVPYLILVAVYLFWDILSRWIEVSYGSTGLGPAVWIGLVGAVLAAQPRESDLFDLTPGPRNTAGVVARLVLIGLGVLFAAASVAGAATSVFRFVDGMDAVAGLRVSVLNPLIDAVAALAWLIIIGRLIWAAAAGEPAAGLALSLPAWAVAGWAVMVSLPGMPYLSVDTVQLNFLGVGLLGGIGAAALSPALPTRRAMTQAQYYLPLLGLVAATSVLWIALSVIRLTLYAATSSTLGALVFFTIALAGAALARDRLANSEVDQHKTLLVLAVTLFGSGLAVLLLMSLRVNWNQPAPMALWLVAITVPAFIIWREALGPAMKNPADGFGAVGGDVTASRDGFGPWPAPHEPGGADQAPAGSVPDVRR
jgi:hypothetical protein